MSGWLSPTGSEVIATPSPHPGPRPGPPSPGPRVGKRSALQVVLGPETELLCLSWSQARPVVCSHQVIPGGPRSDV